jgi:C-terminal processing protease CtpA/Prc
MASKRLRRTDRRRIPTERRWPDFYHFAVTRIVPKSPTVEAGIEAGDVIESIDSLPAERLTLTEMRSMLRRPKVSYTLGILGGNQKLRIEIRLHPLI